MIIDLILDRKCGSPYSPKDFTRRVAEYGENWPAMAAPILDAFQYGTEGTIKAALCQYIIKQEYNPEICNYICSVSWQDNTDVAHSIRIGDILASSWGYEQTNITLYRVIALNGKTMITLQECLLPVAGRKECGPMSCDVAYRIPAIDEPVKYTGKPIKRKVKNYGSGDHVEINSYANAYIYNGEYMYESWYC